MDTSTRLKALIAGLFNCDVAELTDDVGPGGIPGWDSLGHITLIAAIQEQFGKRVPVEDAIEVESIGGLVKILDGLESAS